jgi:uncharacterized membrane protein
MKYLAAFFLASALTISAASAARAIEYTVSELPTPAGFDYCEPRRVNSSGQAVGICYTASNKDERGVSWLNGAVTLLPIPSGYTDSGATAISASGEIVGYAYGLRFDAMLWANGGVRNLGVPIGHDFSQAADINADGVIVGNSDNQAVEWVKGQILTFSGYTFAPLAMNRSGVFVGSGRIRRSDTGGAVIDDGRPFSQPRYLSQTSYGAAWAINDYGEVVGSDQPEYNGTPWSWQYGKLTYLPFLPGESSCTPFGINNLGQIVGVCGIAVLWQSGSVIDLNTTIPKSAGWLLEAATSINESGIIVGYGAHKRGSAFMLQPKYARP